ncbi:3',5'-cyclic adenosine monophosphate phosphodiesterase CpdA [Paenibacillus allorhizoplanae]|uniref:3',5'-cyclic adenosine monophosphate phosphodiesterase CpdA n=1 Tax=Paenibacillus allorhizoplanae TaxID=2905648 RepID=A0ABM9BRS1_9BACL|nr:discoidin domain-containing protein [Paenibacillus allorhizoplanae]CAH1193143.1 3',5'-cyclic adenosine monophosphate phosphodiesterase CpdA [Paenibacillus allorhizoplanae]
MVKVTKVRRSIVSLILLFSLLISTFGYMPLAHAETATAIDAYSLIEAESYSSKSGTNLKVEGCPEGGQCVGGTNDNQYLVYSNIDFGSGPNGAAEFSTRISVKGSNAGGNIEVRLDSPTGTVAGTLAVTTTAADNWNVFQTQSADLNNVTGVHDVYLVLKVAVGKTYVANINWFQFSKTLTSIAITTPPTKKIYRVGDTLDLTGMVVTGTYIDGTTRAEEVRASDVSGFNSSTAVDGQTLTVTVRGKAATFKVDIKTKALTSIKVPAAVTGIINGTAPTPAALGLPSEVVMVTDNGNVNAFVNWNVAGSGYDRTVKTEQIVMVPGTVVLPSDVYSNNVPLSISINVTVLAAVDPNQDTSYKFSFMGFSDTHAMKQGDSQDIALDNAMQDAIRNNAGSVSVAGDITDYGTDDQYNVIMNTMNKYPQVERYFAYGNHDVRWMGGIELAKSRFLTHTGMPGIYSDKWINGYHFIYLGSEADDKDGAYISETQLAWLKVKMAEDASKDKPIFLFLHQPLENTVSKSHSTDNYHSDEAQDQKIKDIVGQYPQSILITGHLHDDIRLPGNMYNEQYFTMIRDGAIIAQGSPGAQGLLFDIYADRVVINGRDVNKRSTIGSWTITNFTTDALSADKQAPTVPANVTAKVVTDKMITLEWEKATDNFNGNVGVVGYDVYNGSTLVGSTTGNTSLKVTGLTANTAYSFTVKARDEAGNASDASHVFNVNTLAYDPIATNLVLNKNATANGNVTGFDPSKAVDGLTTSGSKWSSSTDGAKWLMFDLEQYYDIARWVVKHAGEAGETISLNTKDYKLQGSLNGRVWVDLDEVDGNVSNSTDRYITKSTVRYVRLYITNGQNAFENSTANIYEFAVYGRSYDGEDPPVLGDPNKIPQDQMTASATSEELIGENNRASNVLDGDSATIWHTKWDKSNLLPQSITLNLGGTYDVDKIKVLPRQGGGNGNITAYNVYASMDGIQYTKVNTGTWANDATEKTAEFPVTRASYLKLEATAGVGGYASAAEINVLKEPKKVPQLISITAPANLTGVANGTAKSAVALGLPSTVELVTDSGSKTANVTWNVDAANYDPAVETAQTFTVNGSVNLPAGVNQNNVALTTSISVNVLPAASLPQSTLTGLQEVTVGQAFDVTMGLSNVTQSVYQQLKAQDLTLHYDPAKLQFESVTSVKDGFQVIDQKETAAGQIRIVAASVGANVPSQGDLLSFKFKAKSLSLATNTTITVGSVLIANGQGNELQIGGASNELQIRIPSTPVDKSLLNASIASAQTKYTAAVEGSEDGLYVIGSKAQLQSAIDTARVTANNSNATQQQVDSAKTALEAAIQVFESKKINANVNGDRSISIGDLAIVAGAFGTEQGQAAWNEKADVNHDGRVDIVDLAIVAKAILQ